MKTAENVAEEIFMMRSMFIDNRIEQKNIVSKFAHLITAYAEERVKEEWKSNMGYVDAQKKQARAEALEEAAKTADEWVRSSPAKEIKDNLERLINQIRALKDNP